MYLSAFQLLRELAYLYNDRHNINKYYTCSFNNLTHIYALLLSGVAPPSFVAINAGTTLYKLTTAGEAVSWNSLAVLGILAVLSILPVCFQKKLQKKLD